MNIVEMLAQEMHLKPENVKNVVELIDEGCTIPFIARYRKERTGSMDDQVLRLLSERLEYLRQLEYRFAILRDKYDYLGAEYCTDEEKKLAFCGRCAGGDDAHFLQLGLCDHDGRIR